MLDCNVDRDLHQPSLTKGIDIEATRRNDRALAVDPVRLCSTLAWQPNSSLASQLAQRGNQLHDPAMTYFETRTLATDLRVVATTIEALTTLSTCRSRMHCIHTKSITTAGAVCISGQAL